MADDNILDQSEIERLLSGGGGGGGGGFTPEPEPAANDAESLNQADLDALLSGLGGLGGSSSGGFGASAPPPGPPPAFASAPSASLGEEENKMLEQNEIENLLKGLGGGASSPPPPPPLGSPLSGSGRVPPLPPHSPQPQQQSHHPQQSSGASAAGNRGAKVPNLGGFSVPTDVSADEEGVPQGDIDYLLRRAEEALDSVSSNKMDLPAEVIEFQFPEFGGSVPNTEHVTLDQISEVELDIKIELGRANMYLEDVLKLRKGSVVALDKMAGDAVDIYVNGRLLARGEVLVMNENFCVRVAELLAGAIPME